MGGEGLTEMRARRDDASRLVAVLLGLLALLAGLGASAAAPPPGNAATAPRVLATTLATPVTPVIAEHVAEGIRRAHDGGYAAYVIELDTPGGLVTAMRDIVRDILGSDVPVIVYVSPAGARAGSAGAIISLASHVLVMAPGTTIGAATPVGPQGEKVSGKIVNDAAAQAGALANLRGRDAGFAEEAVRDGRSIAVEEALRLGVADGRATDLAGALRVADGREVTVAGDRTVTVATADATVDRQDLSLFRRVLQVLVDPDLTFLLLVLGALGLIYELATPGVGIAGSVGAVSLVIALFSLSVLPVAAVGVLLLLLAVGLFAAEAFAPGTAGFALGGAVVLVLSSFFLFDSSEGVSVDPAVAVPLAAVLFVGAVLAGRLVMRTRHLPSTTTGGDLLTGRTVRLAEADGATGRAFTEGTWWSVRSTGATLVPGGDVTVVGLDGLTLVVEPQASAPEPQTRASESPAPGSAEVLPSAPPVGAQPGAPLDDDAATVVEPRVVPDPAVAVDERVVPGPAVVDRPAGTQQPITTGTAWGTERKDSA
ncbi:membrane-bound serine protease (ClpP class) [Georgenia soli]|uniref:Membrane-bound serine protease (ClpP class) n=1 Tax=Georgenia soli TaxID=638953 RepID=A0A2A9EM22_9MICO|nr:NfeD family protein [Georgenia soli]PFG39269.1 membrane-bound serine protease (ClpP class) [Georgenia soli]